MKDYRYYDNQGYTDDILESRESERTKERREKRKKLKQPETKVATPKKAREAKYSRRAVLMILALAIILGVLLGQSVYRIYLLNQQRAEVQAKLDELTRTLGELQNELDMVTSDEYVEQQARDQLHMIKPGEVLYIVEQPDESEAPDQSAQPENGEDSGKKQ